MSPLLSLAGLAVGAGTNTHTHFREGPADVGTVELRLESAAPHTVAGQALLHAHCSVPEGSWPDRKPLAIVESWWTPDGRDPQKLARPLALAAGSRGELTFTFAREALYQVCDRWAVDVALVVDGEPRTVRIPLEVTREEPLRSEP